MSVWLLTNQWYGGGEWSNVQHKWEVDVTVGFGQVEAQVMETLEVKCENSRWGQNQHLFAGVALHWLFLVI